MPILTTDDGVKLHYEETGSGTALVFVHEFAGDCRSWEPQVRHFSRQYRCIAYNARGYPPSDVPEDLERYSQARARDDIRCVLDALGSANTMRGYQGRRPSLYDLVEDMKRIDVPTLIMAGDEEEPCLEACLLMKRAIPAAGLAILPRSGHGINLEEPQVFNRMLEDFLHQAELGRGTRRDSRAAVASIYGPGGKP